MKNKITLGRVIDKLMFFYERACSRPDVGRKYSWALYQTWKWCDENEEWRTKDERKTNEKETENADT